MERGDDEEGLLRTVALKNAESILLARQRAEEELRRAQRELQEQSEWLRVTLASIGDAVITTDTDGCVTSLNPLAELLTGWTREDAQGQPLERIFQIFNEESRQPVENPALRSLREGQVVGLANHTILIARDGTERAIDDSAAPIRDREGRIAGVVLVFRDVTHHRKLEAELESRVRELAEADRRKDEFLAML
ncbi:MAG TPA: PAS domain S-box protein, partial [Thermoanaerobaculia bacterium]|nr:PAS domain S-box protein [Thermoanaerobaculia bacterium]